MNIVDVIPLVSAFFVFFLGIIVFLKNTKSRINFTFFLHSISISVWLFSTFMMFINRGNLEKAIFWDRVVYAGVVFIPAFMYHFGLAYTKKRRDIVLYMGYLLSFVFLPLVFTKYFVSDIFIYKWGIHTKAQLFHHIFLIYFVIYVLLWFVNFSIYYKKITSPVAKTQTKYIILGFLLLFSIGPLAYLPAYGISIYPFSYISGVLFTIIVFYAIVKYRLLNIKLVFRSSFVYLLSLLVIFGLASVVKTLANKFFQEFIFWIDLITIFFAVASFPSIKNLFLKWANKYFFTSLYDSGKLILKTGNDLKTFLNIDKIYEYLFSVFSRNLHTKAFGVLNYNEENGTYKLQYNQGFKVKKGADFERNPVVEAKFINYNEIVITEELRNLHYSKKTKDLIELLEKLEVELLIPLKVKGNQIGLIALGPKETNEAYNEEDLQVLEIIAGQSAVAIENAQLYSRVKHFNIKLKKEVKDAVEKVEKTNKDLSQVNNKLSLAYKKLKQLDSAKNEFISIASHQLRTPLTSIKGFISMILEGDYGKVDKEAEGALKKIFISNERLIKLVNDLLSLSRIESGKFSFNFKKDDIIDLIKNVLDDFKLEAKDKNLKIKFIKPDKEVKSFVFDQNKIHEVISNLVDNAIKYTEKGQIEIGVEDIGRKMKIIISDSGKGMSSQELEYVFEKFRRGENSSNLNTEGTGLGLYVCKKIVDAHQGRIYAKSEGTGKGSQFVVELRKDFNLGKR